MARQQRSDDEILQMLNEYNVSDVFSKSDDKLIPQGVASESEDNLEVNSEESDIANVSSDVDSDEDDKLIAKSGRVWRSSVTHCCQCDIGLNP